MKKYIKTHGLVLFLIIPLLITSCSLPEPKSNNDTGQASCENKFHPSLASGNSHQIAGRALIYQGNLQGEKTANCNILDMNSFTAAHPTLPLPSHIKVTNTDTNKSVVVKVNDRLRTQQSAALQVTPAVASLLGAKSSFPVKIQVIPTRNSRQSEQAAQTKPKKKVLLSTRPSSTNKARNTNGAKYYIVVGTYVSQDEAFAKFTRLSSIGIANSTMETRKKKGRLLHMVRIGPFYQQDEIDAVKNRLQNDGLVKFTVVKN